MRIDGIFGTKISPPCMRSSSRQHEVDALLQRDPEPRHARVGDRQDGPVFGVLDWKNGITLPRLPTTLP